MDRIAFEQAADEIAAADALLISAGAGMGVDSGLPDFRGNEGFWKAYDTDGVDFFTARVYISFNIIKQINVQFGYDKLFLGDGIRSMGLSDFTNNYLFLKFDVKVWKLYYRLVIAQHYADVYSAPGTGSLSGPYPRKYFAHHHISFDIGKKLNLVLSYKMHKDQLEYFFFFSPPSIHSIL